MLKPELYKKTVDILYEAYFKDTLEHNNCCACAVGNMVAAGCGYPKIVAPHSSSKRVWAGIPYPAKEGWATVFMTESNILKPFQKIVSDNYWGLAKEQIDSTGYSLVELSSIEYAFEMADRGRNEEDYMFNGLVAVLEVLKEIHEVTDEDAEVNTTRFRAHYKKKLVKDGYRF